MSSKKPYFPEVDRQFLSQTENLILNGSPFRLNRNYPAYLNKLKLAKVKFIIINSKSISYSEVSPSADIRPRSIIKIDDELEKFSDEFLGSVEPDIEIIRSVTGSALEANGVKIKKGNRMSDNGFLKSERLYP